MSGAQGDRVLGVVLIALGLLYFVGWLAIGGHVHTAPAPVTMAAR